MRNVLLSAHIAVTVSALGADLVLLALGVAGLSGADPATVYPAMALIGSWVMSPLAVASLSSGLALALLTRWGVFRYWWVTIKLAITAVLTLLVLLVLGPRFEAAAEAARLGVALTDPQRGQLVITSVVGSGLLIVTIGLAVFKPARRLAASTGRH
ncbi:MAG TPA: hypothetical protein VF364_06290 [Candidatus Limnocylindria bacterium]